MIPIHIKIISDEDAEEMDAVICVRADVAAQFPDDEFGVCSKCACAVRLRPHAPKKPPRICFYCFLKGLMH